MLSDGKAHAKHNRNIAAAKKNGIRSASARLAIWSVTATITPPSTDPIGIMPHANSRYTELTRPSSSSGMICWRSETVMTFHRTPRKEPRAAIAHTTPHEDVSPVIANVTAEPPRVMNRDVPDPNTLESRDASSDPATPPAAAPVSRSPKASASRPRISCTKST